MTAGLQRFAGFGYRERGLVVQRGGVTLTAWSSGLLGNYGRHGLLRGRCDYDAINGNSRCVAYLLSSNFIEPFTLLLKSSIFDALFVYACKGVCVASVYLSGKVLLGTYRGLPHRAFTAGAFVYLFAFLCAEHRQR